jgi:hypothetical protein
MGRKTETTRRCSISDSLIVGYQPERWPRPRKAALTIGAPADRATSMRDGLVRLRVHLFSMIDD